MQEDFHYYATYCAAYLAGYDHEECLDISRSAQFVDFCSKTFLQKIKAPLSAATTQTQTELMDARVDPIGLQDITRIWSSFHFLPYDLYAKKERSCKAYLDKYRLICDTNSDLLVETVKLAKGKGCQAAGVAMHVLADTWSHRYFAGTPSLVINNTNYYFFELLPDGDSFTERKIRFRHKASEPDDPDKGLYNNTVYQNSEISIMNLGHGRAGHLPDYSFIRYKYLPAWGEYEEVIKDNPKDYMKAFCQMVYAMRYLRGAIPEFEKDTYDNETVAPWRERINTILLKRQPNAAADWKALGEELSGQEIAAYDINYYEQEYRDAHKVDKDDTFLGRFILAAMEQKSMITNRIYKSGNMLAGFSVDYDIKGFKGIKDFRKLLLNYGKRN